jgi:hypothetical protein
MEQSRSQGGQKASGQTSFALFALCGADPDLKHARLVLGIVLVAVVLT